MNTLQIEKSTLAKEIKILKDKLLVFLKDGREISIPLEWFPKLRDASKKQLEDYRFIGDGEGIHWEQIDEDILIKNLIY